MRLRSGARLACDIAVLATGAQAPRWLKGSGLALDDQGFIRTGPTLQSVNRPDVFAAGDVAARDDEPRPRSGVQAVRAGPALAHNLLAMLTGEALRSHRPPTTPLYLLSCGDRRAIVSWGSWSAEGSWPWRWKDLIDRRFVDRFNRIKGMSLLPTVEAPSADPFNPRA
jgi:NADH dehydrogenase FAD-containing subunit